jgi:hypothetical protein
LMPNNATTARTQRIHALRCRRIFSLLVNFREARKRWENVNRLLGRFAAIRTLPYPSNAANAEPCLVHYPPCFDWQ